MTLPVALLSLLLPLGSPLVQEGPEDWTDANCELYSLEELDKGNIPPEARARVDCKYGGLLGKTIHILSCSARLEVKGWDASNKTRMLSRGDNIRVYGQFTGVPGKQGGSFSVYNLERMSADDQQFQERRKDLAAGDVEGRLGVADWAKGRYKTYPVRSAFLWGKALETYEEALAILEENAGESDYDAHMEISLVLLNRLEQRSRALDKLRETCLRIRPEDPDLVRFLVQEVQATFYRGKWVLYEDFKAAEGFLQRKEGGWVPAPIALLEAFLTEVDGLSKPDVFRDSMELSVKNKQAVKGMDKHYVLRAISYPEDTLSLEAGDRDLEIWVYPKTYLLFSGGVLYKDPLPR